MGLWVMLSTHINGICHRRRCTHTINPVDGRKRINLKLNPYGSFSLCWRNNGERNYELSRSTPVVVVKQADRFLHILYVLICVTIFFVGVGTIIIGGRCQLNVRGLVHRILVSEAVAAGQKIVLGSTGHQEGFAWQTGKVLIAIIAILMIGYCARNGIVDGGIQGLIIQIVQFV